MTLVRERRHKQGLRLSPPPPSLSTAAADFTHQSFFPALSPASGSDSPGIIENLSDLEKVAVIGHGNGGTVYKVRHKERSCIYALKVLRFDNNAATGALQQAAREVDILKLVDSPYVIRCLGVFDNGGFMSPDHNSNEGGGDLCFVMEYMEGGSLHDVLQARQRLPEQTISRVAKCVLQGLQYLHAMQIVHRDIKPSNLIINNEGEIKISDFGVSEMVARAREACDLCMGTYAYMSPERFDPERWGGGIADGFAGDVWSLGLVVLQCYMGRFPLIGPGQKPDWPTLMCVICFGERLELPDTASTEFRSFVWRCLEKDWRKRANVDELLDHPFVNKTCCSSTDSVFSSFIFPTDCVD